MFHRYFSLPTGLLLIVLVYWKQEHFTETTSALKMEISTWLSHGTGSRRSEHSRTSQLPVIFNVNTLHSEGFANYSL